MRRQIINGTGFDAFMEERLWTVVVGLAEEQRLTPRELGRKVVETAMRLTGKFEGSNAMRVAVPVPGGRLHVRFSWTQRGDKLIYVFEAGDPEPWRPDRPQPR